MESCFCVLKKKAVVKLLAKFSGEVHKPEIKNNHTKDTKVIHSFRQKNNNTGIHLWCRFGEIAPLQIISTTENCSFPSDVSDVVCEGTTFLISLIIIILIYYKMC